MNIKMTSLPVEDPIKAFEFYTKILGFKEHTYIPEGQLAIVVSAEEENGTTLLLEPIDEELYKPFQQAIYKKGYPYLILGSKDVAKDYKELCEKGVVFKSQPKKTDYGITATFDDTCGNFIQIIQD